MPLSWNEIRDRALTFSREWADEQSEDAEAKSFVSREVICSNKIQFVPDATLYHLGVLCSVMHMAWMRAVCGRLKSDYSYSNTIVYNNFPWPEASEKQQTAIEAAAQGVLDTAPASRTPPSPTSTTP